MSSSRNIDFISEKCACVIQTIYNLSLKNGSYCPYVDGNAFYAYIDPKVPLIDVKSYFKRLCKYIVYSSDVPIQVLYHIADIVTRNSVKINYDGYSYDLCFCYNTSHRLIAAFFLLVTKFRQDTYFKLSYLSEILGVNVKEVNTLERHLFSLLSGESITLNVSIDDIIYHFEETEMPFLHLNCNNLNCKKICTFQLIEEDEPINADIDVIRTLLNDMCIEVDDMSINIKEQEKILEKSLIENKKLFIVEEIEISNDKIIPYFKVDKKMN